MKLQNILITFLLTIILAACGTPAVTTSPSYPVAEVTTTSSLVETSMPGIVTFADPMLEAMIRSTMGKTEGDITLAEAQAVTRMNLNNELQRTISEETPIKNLSGLENFTSLETLDLSKHAVTDISPLAGLTKLTALSLAGNPVADVSPLAGLTDLRLLVLSGSQAQDYSALSYLVNLQVLMLDNSTITDLTPLLALTNLRQLYLAKTSVEDLSSLETIYPNLDQKDFIIPSTLMELGFHLDDNSHQAYYDGEITPSEIDTTVYYLPCALIYEKPGIILNSGRWIQYRYQAVEPWDQAKPDYEMCDLLWTAICDLYKKEGGANPDPILKTKWDYYVDGKIDPRPVAWALNGYRVAGTDCNVDSANPKTDLLKGYAELGADQLGALAHAL